MSPIIAAAAISAGASLLGGIFGGGDDKQETVSRVDYEYIRNAARGAGFNPLTALKFGGAANANTTTTIPGLTSGEILANAVAAGTSEYLRHDPIRQETQRLQNKLLTKEIEAYDKQKPGFIRGVATTNSLISGGGGELGSVRPKARPTSEAATIPIFDLTNNPMRITPSQARRLDVEPWDKVEPGVLTELEGEVIGEVGALVSWWDRGKETGQIKVRQRDANETGWGIRFLTEEEFRQEQGKNQ